MPDVNVLPPLVVLGVSTVPEHRFAVVWPKGNVSSFSEWEQLKACLREKAKSGDLDVMQARVYVYTKDWMQVPHPGV